MEEQNTITREKIANYLQEVLGLSHSICNDIVSEMFKEITEMLLQDKKVILSNFGTWQLKHKGTRLGFNIHAHESITIEPRNVLRFVPSRRIKNQINKNHGAQ